MYLVQMFGGFSYANVKRIFPTVYVKRFAKPVSAWVIGMILLQK